MLAVLALSGCDCGSPNREPTVRPSRPAVVTGDTESPTTLAGGPWNEGSPLGTNLSAFYDWSTELPLIDLFKMSRPWISGTDEVWEDDRPIDVDEHGWVRSLRPGQLVRTLMLWDNVNYRPGRYVLRYEGEGEIDYHGSSAVRLVESESRPGRHVLDIDPSRSEQGLGMDIRATNPDNYLRNMVVVPSGGACAEAPTTYCDADQPCDVGECLSFEDHHEELIFHPDFLERTKRYALIRYLDWIATNDSEVRTWDDRPKMDDARWSERGAPPEILIELSNRLHAHAWMTVPHLADDDYNRRFAELVKERLDPGLELWIEYSNEVWNGIFSQFRYAEEQGQAAGLGDDLYHGALLFYSERSVEVFDLWTEVLGPDRLVRVMGAQAANAWTAEVALDHQSAHEKTDVLAIAPYFGINAEPENRSELRGMSVDELLDKTEREVLPEVFSWIDAAHALTEERNLQLVAYEGGQHFVGVQGLENDDEINALYDAVNRHPRMGELYVRYLVSWRQRGGTLFVNFVNCDGWSKWGRWGALEYITQPTEEAHRYRALQRFIDENPRWW
ncbi:MAG: hypothetical protein AAGF12_21580 [Myxococcota bacterium]